MMDTGELLDFQRAQLERWPMAAANFKALEGVETKIFRVGDVGVAVQYNPARIASTSAKVDAVSLAKRPCFLCRSNRPAEQMAIDAGDYEVLVNPFPIFPVHFTIAAKEHAPQLISGDGCRRFADMLQIACQLPGLALFYNGPRCGASAPDHFHFQAVEVCRLPLFEWFDCGLRIPYRVEHGCFFSIYDGVEWLKGLFDELQSLPENFGEVEPRVNILCRGYGNGVEVAVIPRRAHRPDFFGYGEGELLLSPASVDLAGVVVAPSPEDFNRKLTAEWLEALFRQTCY